MSPSDDLSFDGDSGWERQPGTEARGAESLLVGAGEELASEENRVENPRGGRGSPGGRVRCDDAPVVIGCSVRLVHEVVETTELLARGLARLHRGRHCPAREGFSPPALCWRGDRNYVIASAVRSGELTGACVRSRATVRDSDESDGVSVASMRGSRVR